jgi:hypothetical protein
MLLSQLSTALFFSQFGYGQQAWLGVAVVAAKILMTFSYGHYRSLS